MRAGEDPGGHRDSPAAGLLHVAGPPMGPSSQLSGNVRHDGGRGGGVEEYAHVASRRISSGSSISSDGGR